MRRRSIHQKRRADDRGLAGVLGLILLLALAVTVYANAVRTDIPIYGEEAERAWDADIAATLRQLGRATGQGVAEGAPVSVSLSAPPTARAVDVPFIGRTEPLKPSGTVSFQPDCSSFTATHTIDDGSTVVDLQGGSAGCLAFDARPVYSRPFGYRMEFGGILRLQGGRAVVVASPPLEVTAASPIEHRVSISLPGLRGHASSVSNDAASVRVDFVPGPSSREVERATNAHKATWTLSTAQPLAWKSWLDAQMMQSGLTANRPPPLAPGQSAADYTLSCQPVDCTVGASGRGTVTLVLHGPRTDVADLKLSFTYGLYDANLN